jgi:NTE family protein
MKFGLMLGGGGAVGVPWLSGVLAGLMDGNAMDPRDASLIVGTSAGSAVGADIALGRDPHEILERGSQDRGQAIPPLDPTKGPFAEIIKLLLSGEARTPEGAARVGKLAMEAPTNMSEEEFLSMWKRAVGEEWPELDFRPTCSTCETGEPRAWTAADGIELHRAVASSCALPGYFPPVPFQGQHYLDGYRGRNYHARIAGDAGLDAAIYVGLGPMGVKPMEEYVLRDMAALEETGVRVHTIIGSERMKAARFNLMDVTKRREAFETGVADGRDFAPLVAALLG